MLTVWFNRTYGAHGLTFELLRSNPDKVPVRVLASHPDPESPVLALADEGYDEPVLEADDYVAWALDFCATHGVDVVVPRVHRLALAQARTTFELAGTGMAAGPAEAIELLADKARAYDIATGLGLRVPPHAVITTAPQLLEAVQRLRHLGELCVKPVTGVGGEGFRRLREAPPTVADLATPFTTQVGLDELYAALEADEGAARPLMVMPYLPGPEISVDCLGGQAGQLAVAVSRVTGRRARRLVADSAAIDAAAALVEHHRLESLSNTQLRYWQQPGVDREPRAYLLETNTRAAAGLHQTALASVNLPWGAVRVARGLPPEVPAPTYGATYVMLPEAVRLRPG